MENKTEDEIRKRWEQEAKDKADQGDQAQERPKKRARAIEYQNPMLNLFTASVLGEASDSTTANGRVAAKSRGAAAKKPSRAAAAKARGKVTEMSQDEDDVIEVD
jgi:hypothetical protein